MKYDYPVLDLNNPCYSPTLDGDAYLTHVASVLLDPPRSRDQYLLSFLARLIYPAKNGGHTFVGWPPKHPRSTFCEELLSSQESQDSSTSDPDRQHLTFHTDKAGNTRIHSTVASPAAAVPVKRNAALLHGFSDFLDDSELQSIKRRRLSDSFDHVDSSAVFSDLRASSRCARSSNLSVNQSSFEVTKADRFTVHHLGQMGHDGSSSVLNLWPEDEEDTPDLEIDVTMGKDDSDDETRGMLPKGAYMRTIYSPALSLVLCSWSSTPWSSLTTWQASVTLELGLTIDPTKTFLDSLSRRSRL